MNNKETNIGLLHAESDISKDFNEMKFRQFIQDDFIFPIQGVKKNYVKQDILIREGADTNDVYFIEQGMVAATLDGNVAVDFFTKNDVIGLSNLTLGSKSDYTFTVLSDEIEVTRYRKEDLIEKIMNTQEGYLYHYMHMQNTASRLLARQELLQLPTEERIIFVLLELSEKYGNEVDDKDMLRFPKQINKGRIAQYTNFNASTIATVLQKLQEEACIYPVRSAIFVNTEKLETKLEAIS
ncbi:Crp/Fnr family transcriptional regulator [Listeria booriae]|uniref:Crp/Fnr family transcriptional regulator n=1 Tax=Listeria booriae TaxID=1552123 RepID=UPI00162921B7|nr:Crp/Fnr family transcriptional regulator [Listeria booriae]MBC1907651.1 Crp/Fnr family transcriptional regulator [Listeria booriae]